MVSNGTDAFWELFHALPEAVRTSARRRYALWKSDHYHPSLHFKRVSENHPLYSARVNQQYRVLGLVEDEGASIYWFWIGTHEEYEELIAKYAK